MTEIVNGSIRYNELTKNANGGTELIARRMIDFIDPKYLQGYQIIHSRVRELEPNLKKILVCHDLANDPEVAKLTDPEYRRQFEKIVFVSNWQQHTYNMVLGVPFSESLVIPNTIKPLNDKSSSEGPIKLIYHTTPHRGLSLLASAFNHLVEYFDIELDVYSSFKAYGWEERDQQYEKLFEFLDNHPKIRNHGFQSNEVVRQALEESHIFAYPNIWPETSCLALIEAISAGNICLHSNLGALPETSYGLSETYMYSENVNEHVNVFTQRLAELLELATKDRNGMKAAQSNLSNAGNSFYTESRAKRAWEKLLGSL